MQKKSAKFTFTVPEGHPEAGTKIEKSFDYQLVDSTDEANKVISERKWSIVGMVNDNLKSNARSNAYQNALMPYKPSEVSPEDIKERMIRDFIRMGVSEEIARTQVDAILKSQASV